MQASVCLQDVAGGDGRTWNPMVALSSGLKVWLTAMATLASWLNCTQTHPTHQFIDSSTSARRHTDGPVCVPTRALMNVLLSTTYLPPNDMPVLLSANAWATSVPTSVAPSDGKIHTQKLGKVVVVCVKAAHRRAPDYLHLQWTFRSSLAKGLVPSI